MKKFLTAFVLFIVVLSSTPALASTNVSSVSGANTTVTKDEASRMINRVEEIRKMDRKNLSTSERKELKKELIAMKKRAADPGAGVYISGTALLLIIILLIILL